MREPVPGCPSTGATEGTHTHPTGPGACCTTLCCPPNSMLHAVPMSKPWPYLPERSSTQHSNGTSQTHSKDIAFINGAGPVHLFVSQLEVDVGVPGLLLRLPFHPALKHLPGASNVSQHLLHIRVFVPLTKSSSNIGHGQNDLGEKMIFGTV